MQKIHLLDFLIHLLYFNTIINQLLASWIAAKKIEEKPIVERNITTPPSLSTNNEPQTDSHSEFIKGWAT